jgi:hypothetical protein
LESGSDTVLGTDAEASAADARNGQMPNDVHEATDLAEDGLSIIAAWEAKGTPRFRPIAVDLLRFGRAVYSRYQPQFVDEFIREHAALVRAMGTRGHAP